MSYEVRVKNDPSQPGTFALERHDTMSEALDAALSLTEFNDADGREYYVVYVED